MKYKNRLIVPTLVSTGLIASTIVVNAEEIEQHESQLNTEEYTINDKTSEHDLDFISEDEDEAEPPKDNDEEEDSEDENEAVTEDAPEASDDEAEEVSEEDTEDDVENIEETEEPETQEDETVEEDSVSEEEEEQEVSEEAPTETAGTEESISDEKSEVVEEATSEAKAEEETFEDPVSETDAEEVEAQETSEPAEVDEVEGDNKEAVEEEAPTEETAVEDTAAEANQENEESVEETVQAEAPEENIIPDEDPETEESIYEYDSDSLQHELTELSDEERTTFLEESADDIEVDEETLNELTEALAQDYGIEAEAAEVYSASTMSTMSLSQAIDDINEYIAANNFEVAPIQYDYIEGLPTYAYYSDYGWEPENGIVGKPEGVVLHDVGNDNSTIYGEISWMTENQDNAFVHAFVDANNIIQVADTDYLAYGAGPVSNELHMHVELVRHDNAHDFAKSINNYADYIANLLYKYKLPVVSAEDTGEGTLWSHVAVSEHLGGTNSPDPYDYFARFGYEYNDVIDLIGQRYDDMYHKHTAPRITMPIEEGTTNVLAQVNENNLGLYASVTDVRTSNASNLAGQTFYVDRTATYNYDDYYLLQNEEGVALGWMNEGDLLISEYVPEPEEEEIIEDETPEEPEEESEEEIEEDSDEDSEESELPEESTEPEDDNSGDETEDTDNESDDQVEDDSNQDPDEDEVEEPIEPEDDVEEGSEEDSDNTDEDNVDEPIEPEDEVNDESDENSEGEVEDSSGEGSDDNDEDDVEELIESEDEVNDESDEDSEETEDEVEDGFDDTDEEEPELPEEEPTEPEEDSNSDNESGNQGEEDSNQGPDEDDVEDPDDTDEEASDESELPEEPTESEEDNNLDDEVEDTDQSSEEDSEGTQDSTEPTEPEEYRDETEEEQVESDSGQSGDTEEDSTESVDIRDENTDEDASDIESDEGEVATGQDDAETEAFYSTLEDPETGVRVSSAPDELEGKSLVVTVLNPSSAISADHDLYDIHILDAGGSLYNLENPATVHLPANGYVSNVYYLGDIGETLEAVEFTMEDDYAAFKVSDFSQYAVVYGNEGADNTAVAPVYGNKDSAGGETLADFTNEHSVVYTEKETESDVEGGHAEAAEHDSSEKTQESEMLPNTGVAEQSTTIFATILATLGLGFLVKRRKTTEK